MKTQHYHIISQLTPRERDCLRLLAEGRETKQLASELGLSDSTVNKHLASARKKLGVNKTAQALLIFETNREIARHSCSSILLPEENDFRMSETMCDFANKLQSCKTFDDSWRALEAHVERLGAEFMNFAVVAEPPGLLTNGARILRSSLDPEIQDLYKGCGGAATDPTVLHIAKSTHEQIFDLEYIVHIHATHAPPRIKEMAYAALEGLSRFLICKPERDVATGAPYSTAFGLHTSVALDCKRHSSEVTADLRATTRLFWDHLLSINQLHHFAGLSLHQRNVLTLAARGFSAHESADHMGVSIRSIEKTLTGARKKLGARTTAAAMYRAMVYRALV